jgi:2-methylcitrate dehydratase PrpD
VTPGEGKESQLTGLTQDLARFTSAAEVPGDVRTGAARAISAVAAAAAAGADTPAVITIAKVAGSLGTPSEAGVPGRRERYGASVSALLAAAAASASAGSSVSYATVVVPAGLATGAAQGLRLAEVADAVSVGLEIARRLQTALAGQLGAFDLVCVIGRLAAAATAGRLLGLAPAANGHALGVAATQAAGFAAVAAEPAGVLQNGKAAADAVEAAFLALGGFTASPAGIEGRRGFAALLAPGAQLDAAANGLGQVWASAASQPYGEHGPAELSQPADAFISSFPPTKRS